MTTPVFITGFEQGVVSTNGAGLVNAISGNIAVQSAVKNTGQYAAKVDITSSAALIGKTISSSVGVVRIYVRIDTPPASSTNMVLFIGVGTNAVFRYDTTSQRFEVLQTSETPVQSNITISTGVWYRIDLKADWSGTTHTIEWQIDGIPQTTFSIGGQSSDTFDAFRFGSVFGTNTVVSYFDDIVVSYTAADYPIGPGGTELLLPSSDGTHNAGTNIMEDNTGADIGVVPAYDKINKTPFTDVTKFIRQLENGTGNYVEILFGDIQSAHSEVIGALAILAYTSAATQANNGGCIISKDDFSTHTVIHGAPGALADYSDGSTSNLFYKTALVVGAIDDSTVNALKARLGYSGDANPDPYWINLGVEVAYALASNTIDLDLVSYSVLIKDVSILESEIIHLDLVSYSSEAKDVMIVQNETTSLDLVSYLVEVKDVTLLESEIINLDLVSYSLEVWSITLLESEIINLDLISYSTSVPELMLLENEIIDLDLVSYSTSFLELMLLESDVTQLDLVFYALDVKDITISESEITDLELVSYSLSINDLVLLENEILALDLITYSSEVKDITLIAEDSIGLDLVSYSSVVNDLIILEHEVLSLELITYFGVVNDLLIPENEIIVLELVIFTSIIRPVNLSGDEVSSPPLDRCFLVMEEPRRYIVLSDKRFIAIDHEERSILIY